MKKVILLAVCAMVSIAAAVSMTSTYFISSEKIDGIILEDSQVQAEFLAMNASYILENSETPLDELQTFVSKLSQRSAIAYAIVIDRNVQAVAHSDPQKRNKIYKDDYTIKGATKGVIQYSRWYAEVQGYWVFDIMAPIYVNGELYGTFDIGIPITQVDKATNGIVIAQLVAMLGVFGICIITFVLLIDKLMKPLFVLKDALQDVAQGDGDLTARLPVKGKDEISQISSAFNVFVEKIHETISQVANTGVELNNSALSLREQSKTALERGENQNEQTLLVVTSMNEMVATVNEVASNAASAADSANTATEESQNGYDILEKATNSITSLEDEMSRTFKIIGSLADKTDSIGSILDVIRGISEQTNLLALNAAIEAARAGEAGRGFAVVADEVRNLATKTSQSTDEIDTMIQQLQTEAKNAVQSMEQGEVLIKNGASEARLAQQALDVIAKQVRDIWDKNTQVATATEQQSTVANEINISLDAVNHSVNLGLTASKELELSSKQLADSSQALERYVGEFKL
ncbi:TPA: HAMP domain-containing protein [Vibrio vulnificus]|uniref:methyl-accepting chemotaxis protein n=1 Tax=Vibrio TaxID=662 RepID=UPI001A2EDB38|nr:HAMP domain-containing protein [Vibrio parahaemolyticus]MBE4258745.1 HAMP domain-containing protein [Vibrio parahaemolyticus]HAS6068756.1 HAMP domain-containing protein [Vibrio vulnificus]